MKKVIALLIAILLCASSAALAEGALSPDIDYEGTWMPVKDFGFSLYLPNDWFLFEEEENFYAGNEQASRYFWVEAYESKGYTVDDILTEFTQLYDEAQIVSFSEAQFVTFKATKEDIFCGVTPSLDGEILYFFRFVPAKDADFVGIANMILSSITFSAQ